MNQQKGRIAELLPKQSGRELSYIIFFAQIVIIAAILCVTFTDVGAEKLTGLILVLALASLIAAIKLLKKSWSASPGDDDSGQP